MMWVRSLGQEDPLEKEMTTHSSILAWRIPWTEEPGGLECIGSQWVGHDWNDLACTHSYPKTHINNSEDTHADFPKEKYKHKSRRPLLVHQKPLWYSSFRLPTCRSNLCNSDIFISGRQLKTPEGKHFSRGQAAFGAPTVWGHRTSSNCVWNNLLVLLKIHNKVSLKEDVCGSYSR